MRMPWKTSQTLGVLVSVLAVLAPTSNATVCGDNSYSVSVQNDPTVYCVTSRPCSGDYQLLSSHQASVGVCPNHASCALLPHAGNVMGCVVSGQADVTYVNADGTLTRNGATVTWDSATSSGTTTSTSTSTSTSTTTSSTDALATATANADVYPSDSTSGASATTTSSSQAAQNSVLASTASNDTASASSNATASSNTTATTVPVTTTPVTTAPVTTAPATTAPTSTDSSQTSVATNQQSMSNINGDNASHAKSDTTTGSSFGSIVAIVVGCLAVVAIVAGVFVLRKNKEKHGDEMETPVDVGVNVNEYGGGSSGLTPKDEVQLL